METRESENMTFQLEKSRKISVNHAGFTPAAYKFCVMEGTDETSFTVNKTEDNSIVYKGMMKSVRNDFGPYLVGDFTELKQSGTYRIFARKECSYDFQVRENVYDNALQKVVQYFQKQRCGNTTLNWRGEPCHLDDGKRYINGVWEHRDCTGGWHDACDVRKWQEAVVHGLIGLTHIWDALNPSWDLGMIYDELKWGNAYQLKLQESEGYVLANVGLDSKDANNHWTDNVIENTENSDDRQIQDNHSSKIGMLLFMLGNALIARKSKDMDPAYSDTCKTAAQKQNHWFKNNIPYSQMTSWELGALIAADVELYKASGDIEFKAQAVSYAKYLLDLQVTSPIDSGIGVRGFFKTSFTDDSPFKDWVGGNSWPLIGLCELLKELPEHEDAPRWENAIRMYCYDYLCPLAGCNAFEIVPYALYSKLNPGAGKNRPLVDSGYSYRYFMYIQPEISPWWYCGNNAAVASAGVGLIKAAEILKDPELVRIAQRQLDWIIGCNPFNSTTMTGVGYNEGRHFDFQVPPNPVIPLIDGGVRNGICGDESDMPSKEFLESGAWNSMEYWTPMVSYTAWLMAELQALELCKGNRA